MILPTGIRYLCTVLLMATDHLTALMKRSSSLVGQTGFENRVSFVSFKICDPSVAKSGFNKTHTGHFLRMSNFEYHIILLKN